MTTLTPAELFKFASSYATGCEAAGQGTQYPTFRQCARRFRVKIEDVQDAIDDWSGHGYLGAIVAIQTGAGVGAIQRRGDYQVEAYQ